MLFFTHNTFVHFFADCLIRMVAERKEHVFKELSAGDSDQQPMEIESYCVNCGENVRQLNKLRPLGLTNQIR